MLTGTTRQRPSGLMEKPCDTDNSRAESGVGGSSGVLYVFPSSHKAVCALVEGHGHDLQWAPTKKIDRKHPGDDDGDAETVVVDDAKVSPGATVVHFLTSDNVRAACPRSGDLFGNF